jgi:hypothetical protein
VLQWPVNRKAGVLTRWHYPASLPTLTQISRDNQSLTGISASRHSSTERLIKPISAKVYL